MSGTPATPDWFHTIPRTDPTRKQAPMTETTSPVHISVVLDRSGSMSSIAGDIVGGFNEFLAEQRKETGTARITLVQFDGEDPFEVLIDGTDLWTAADLDRSAYRPRGMTPLYDAVGRMIERIDAGIGKRKRQDLEAEDQVVAIVTDGLENASRHHTRSTVFDLIEDRRKDGWVFVFLGANQDSFASGGAMAVPAGNRADWAATPRGSKKMWRDLSHSSSQHRAKPRSERRADSDHFYQEDPDDAK
ncbi:MAG: VWA domain-containing protein [Actinobacteria bacterium]|nr:VWA domain-containing protein [Actinomycetota bacterium]MBU1494669.1 VWA domain-containing protein [Actinomycetota bacterium]